MQNAHVSVIHVLRPERGCDCPPRAPIGVDSTGPTRIREMVIGRSKRRKKLLILGWPGPIGLAPELSDT